MKTSVPFAPYQGAEDYIFVSYAHKDSVRVFEVISALHRRFYRVWYDQGIEIGADWPQVVAEKLQRSALVLIFLSENALRSQNCRREIHYAVSQKKNMLVVLLDDSTLPADIAMQLSVVPQLRFSDGAQTGKDFLSINALNRAVSVAVPRLKISGKFNVPESMVRQPIILRDGTGDLLVKSFEWDLYNDEIRIEATMLPVATLEVASETITSL